MNMHISNANNQVHELAPPTCVLLLSKNVDPPQYCSLLIHVMSMLALSSPLYLCPNILYLCPNFSTFVINDHKRPDTIWNLCHMKINGYHLKILPWKSLVAWCKELDLGRWLSLDSSFLMDTFNWLVLTPLVTTTCGSMKTTLKCHM